MPSSYTKTVEVSDELHGRLKKRAANLRQKLKFVVEDTLLVGLSKQKTKEGAK